ncbi:MAG TPA: DUF4159 domain-containing protein [Vicinamibacterales bacterium]|nr:DUF4159 domain-containing protein [Vicinamibacterales bacterium]
MEKNGRSARGPALVVVVTLMLTLTLPAQRRDGRRFGFGSLPRTANTVEYDGRFTIVRLWYPDYGGWSFDYPDMEQNLTLILNELTALRARPDGSNILRMDDPELLKFPVAYLSEPGYWYPSDSEALGLRRYLAKGGFLIVDDFHFEQEWRVFEAAMNKVLPGSRIDRLQLSHPVFNTFFSIKSLDVPYPGRLGENGLMGEFYGIHEGNDPSSRLMVVISYNMDIGDYMEHSGRGFYAVDPTNEAFKFGVNYFIYGLSH